MSSSLYDAIKKKYSSYIVNRTYRSSFTTDCLDTSYYIYTGGEIISRRVGLGNGNGGYNSASFIVNINQNINHTESTEVKQTNTSIKDEFNDSNAEYGFNKVHANFSYVIKALSEYLPKFKHRYYDKNMKTMSDVNYFSINSSYRTPTHNTRVKGSATSEHRLGFAVDISFRQLAADELASILIDSNILPGYSSKKLMPGNKINQVIVYIDENMTRVLTNTCPKLVESIRNKDFENTKRELKALMDDVNTETKISRLQELCLSAGRMNICWFIHFGCNPKGNDHPVAFKLHNISNIVSGIEGQIEDDNIEMTFDRQYYYNEVLK